MTTSAPPVPVTSRRRAAEEALQAEADALAYPSEAAQCLLEAAHSWRRAGDAQRALDVLAGWPDWPDADDARFARVDIAESLLALDRTDEAERVLQELRAERPSAAVCISVGELYEELEQWQQALGWFDLAVSGLSASELAGAADPYAALSNATQVLRGRQRARGALALAPDVLNQSLPDPLSLSRLLASNFPTSEQLLQDPRAPLAGTEIRTLFWPRTELDRALSRWPEVFGEDDFTYYCDLEQRLHQLSARSGRSVTLVPAHVDTLAEYAGRTGGDVADSGTRQAYMNEQAAGGHVTVWPLGRNQPCWCESGAKYKKCCGRSQSGS